jgi:hypothetical protein
VSTVNPAMPKKLDPSCQKLLAKDPAQRYASAEQLQEDLDGWMHAGQPKRGQRAGSGCGLGVVVLLLLIAAGWRGGS